MTHPWRPWLYKMFPDLSSPFSSPKEASCLPALPVHTLMPCPACGNFSLTHSFLQETRWELPPWVGLVTGNGALAAFPLLTVSHLILSHRARFLVIFYATSTSSCVERGQRGITPLRLGVLHLTHLCLPMRTAGASLMEGKYASAQRGQSNSSWILL